MAINASCKAGKERGCMKGSRRYDSRVLSPLTVSYPYVLCMCIHNYIIYMSKVQSPDSDKSYDMEYEWHNTIGHMEKLNISVNVYVYSILECICIKINK